MKILILQDDFPPDSFGGAGIIAFNLAKAYQKKGHSVFVITSVQNKADEGNYNYEGLVVYKIYSNYPSRLINIFSLHNPFILGKIKKLIKEINPDIVHAHNVHYSISYSALKIAKKSGAKVFLTAHDVMSINYGKLNNYFDKNNLSIHTSFNYKLSFWHHFKTARKRYNPLRNIIIRHYLKYTDKIFTVSSELKDALNQNGIKNVKVIHNGIDISRWIVSEDVINKFKKKYNLQERKVVLFGGRLSELKGSKKVLEAMEIVSKEIPNATLLILAKEDNGTQKIKITMLKKGIKVIFTGWIFDDSLKAAYWSSDVITTPSLCFDSFPTMNLEAMACKKPVVGTCFGGTPEVVQDGVTGYIVNPYNVQNFAERIIDLLSNDKKAEAFGLAGYERVKTEFSLEEKVDEHIAMYETFLEKEK